MKPPLQTLSELLRHFAARHRALLIPLVVVLLLASVLLLITSAFGLISPFVYALF